jgi:hypothetical protein
MIKDRLVEYVISLYFYMNYGIGGSVASHLSSPKLAQVVVVVKPAPAHPLLMSKVSEEGVAGTAEPGVVEAVELSERILTGSLEISGSDAQRALIQFGPAFHIVRPLSWIPKRGPLHYSLPKKAGMLAHFDFAEWDPDSIRYVAEHLVDIHPAPLGRVFQGDGPETSDKKLVVIRVGESMHCRSGVSSLVPFYLILACSGTGTGLS